VPFSSPWDIGSSSASDTAATGAAFFRGRPRFPVPVGFLAAAGLAAPPAFGGRPRPRPVPPTFLGDAAFLATVVPFGGRPRPRPAGLAGDSFFGDSDFFGDFAGLALTALVSAFFGRPGRPFGLAGLDDVAAVGAATAFFPLPGGRPRPRPDDALAGVVFAAPACFPLPGGRPRLPVPAVFFLVIPAPPAPLPGGRPRPRLAGVIACCSDCLLGLHFALLR